VVVSPGRRQAAETAMKILHILSDGPQETSSKVIKSQSRNNHVKIIGLSKHKVQYDTIIDSIFDFDKVISWKKNNQGKESISKSRTGLAKRMRFSEKQRPSRRTARDKNVG
jgi:hypothetical protein